MTAGHLQEKKGFFYIVLNYKDESNNRKTKWIPTCLTVKGNKKRAESMLMDARKCFVPPVAQDIVKVNKDMLFADFLAKWLQIAKSTIKLITYASYAEMLSSTVEPYFRKKNVALAELKAQDIQGFYTEQLERVSANTVIHYHAIIHRALKYAVKTDLIATSPADKVDLPKKDQFVGSFYDSEEVNNLFAYVSGKNIEVPVRLATFYGLRRSEVLGLKWDAIDFNLNTIIIRHTVTSCTLDGKHIEIAADTTKTKSSLRTLPLIPSFREMLLALKEQQKVNQRLCGRSYCKDYPGYICINEMGERMKPSYLTETFKKTLERNGMRIIRFHDLRHSCASLLLANGVPLKQIQDWLGHSDFSTTANIYAHLEYNSKLTSASAMMNGLGMGTGQVSTPKV